VGSEVEEEGKGGSSASRSSMVYCVRLMCVLCGCVRGEERA